MLMMETGMDVLKVGGLVEWRVHWPFANPISILKLKIRIRSPVLERGMGSIYALRPVFRGVISQYD
jgi:hypothetical protein